MYIKKSKTIVLKIGSSNIVDRKGKPKESWLRSLVKDLKILVKEKKKYCSSFIWRYSFRSKLFKIK